MKKSIPMVVLLLALAACGGGGGRPSQAEIVKALKDTENPASALTLGASGAALDCIADALRQSDLSDKALRALVEGDEKFEGTDGDLDAMQAAAGEIAKCVSP